MSIADEEVIRKKVIELVKSIEVWVRELNLEQTLEKN
jgi:hypothetical protein